MLFINNYCYTKLISFILLSLSKEYFGYPFKRYTRALKPRSKQIYFQNVYIECKINISEFISINTKK